MCVCADRVLMWFEIKIIRICKPKGSMVKCSPSIIKVVNDFDYDAAKGFLVQHKTPKTLPCTVCVRAAPDPCSELNFLCRVCISFTNIHALNSSVESTQLTPLFMCTEPCVCVCVRSYKSFGLCIKISRIRCKLQAIRSNRLAEVARKRDRVRWI